MAIGNKLEIVSLKVTPIRSIMSSDDILVDGLTVGSSLRVCMEDVRWANVWMCLRRKTLRGVGCKEGSSSCKISIEILDIVKGYTRSKLIKLCRQQWSGKKDLKAEYLHLFDHHRLNLKDEIHLKGAKIFKFYIFMLMKTWGNNIFSLD